MIISPHSTDNLPGLTNRLQTDLLCENLRRYLDDEPLVNVLDKELLLLACQPSGRLSLSARGALARQVASLASQERRCRWAPSLPQHPC